jgi:phage terminase large subunit
MEARVKVIKKIYAFLQESQKQKEIIVYGGAGSGKSYTVAQFLLIEKLLSNRNKRLLITRKYNPSLKVTTWQLVHEILNELEIPYMENKTEQVLQLPRRNEIYFRGLDDAEKIKSSEFNYIWMEEATEFDYEDYLQLKLRLRRATNSVNQMFLTFNPVAGWTQKQFFEQENDDVAILHTTYIDNPFLDSEYTKMLEYLKEQDKAYYQIYTLGEYAILKNKVYNNYVIVKDVPAKFDEIVYGLDFGYNNPTACLKIGIKDDDIYILDELYETHLTNEDLIEKLKNFVDNRYDEIYSDTEPDRIKEIERAGFNIRAAKKAKQKVANGIDLLKRKKIYIHEDCINTIDEIKNYKYKEDSKGNILDEPVKFKDHAMDAMRYACEYFMGYDETARNIKIKIKRSV